MAAARSANSLEPIADATMERWLTPAFRARDPNRWQQIRDTVAATTVEGYCGTVAALSHFDFTAELPNLRVPALVLYGEDDKATSHEENERLARLIPGGRFVAFPGARHLPNVEDPDRFNAILCDWLDLGRGASPASARARGPRTAAVPCARDRRPAPSRRRGFRAGPVSYPVGCSITMSAGTFGLPAASAMTLPGVTAAVPIATAPVMANALWQACGMK